MQSTNGSKQAKTGNGSKHDHSAQDLQICDECSALMRKSAEQCRSWREKTESAVCKGGFATAAFVCDSLAVSMEKCREMVAKKAA